MLDIRLIREQPALVKERLATRGGDDAAKIDELLQVDAERRKADLAKPRGGEAPEELAVLGAAWLGRARLIDNVLV